MSNLKSYIRIVQLKLLNLICQTGNVKLKTVELKMSNFKCQVKTVT